MPGKIHPDCQQAVVRAAAYCEQLGFNVEFCSPPVAGDALRYAFDVLFSANVSALVNTIREQHPDTDLQTLVEPATHACAESARRFSAVDYIKALQITQSAARRMGEFFREFNLLLTPTLANPPLLLVELSMQIDDWQIYLNRLLDETPFTPLFNATGAPAASDPMGLNEYGLPLGVQFGGPLGSEAMLLRVARQIELIAPWHHKI